MKNFTAEALILVSILAALSLGSLIISKNASPPVAYEITIDGRVHKSDIFIISDKSVIFTDDYGRQIEVSIERVENVKEVR